MADRASHEAVPEVDGKTGMEAINELEQRSVLGRPAEKSAAREKLSAIARDVQKGLSPGTMGDAAKAAGSTLRYRLAEVALARVRAQHAAADSIKALDRLSPEERDAFIHRVEAGEAQPTPELQKAHEVARTLLDEGRHELQALGRLQNGFYENYFPHLWKNPKQVDVKLAEFYGKRPFEGPKSFLKKRTYPTYAEGLDAGLTPKFDNPMEAMLAHRAMVDRYVAAMKTVKDGLSEGWIKRVMTDYRPPAGWRPLPESFGTMYGPRKLPVMEGLDANLYGQLRRLASDLGIPVERPLKSGVFPDLGHTSPGGPVVARFATPIGTLAHEIGHQLDFKYGLWSRLRQEYAEGKAPEGQKTKFQQKRAAIGKELRALADLRVEDPNAPPDEQPRGTDYHRSKEEKMAQLVDLYATDRNRLKQVAPETYKVLDGIISEHPELHQMRAMRPSSVRGARVGELDAGGTVIAGRLYAPPQVVKLFDNHLDPGLQNSPIYQALRSGGNSMNQFQLGFSGFHAGFTTLDAMVSKAALGIEQLSRGEFGSGLANIAKGASPTTVFTNLMRGNRVMREALSGEMTEDVKRVLEGGGRFGQDQFYSAGATRAFQKALREGKYAQGVLRAPLALAEKISSPILEWLVPRQKLGVMLDLAESELRRLGPDATPAERRYALARAQDSVDNRMGQLIYDNNFWNRTAKDLAMLSVRSVGWNLGTIREIGGAGFDLATIGKRLGKKGGLQDAAVTHRMAYALALPTIVGLYGALYQKLRTGKDPEDAHDLFFPRTGKVNPDGSEERVALPSYMKDVYAYGHQPGTVLAHKLHPMISTIAEMLQNKDYWGTEIRDPEDSASQQALELAQHVAKSVVPFSVQGYQRMSQAGEPLDKRLQPFVGVVPAPAYLARTKAQNVMAEEAAAQRSEAPRDREQAQRTQTSRELERLIRTGDIEGARTFGREALQSGKITTYDLGQLEGRLGLSLNQVHFKPLPLESKLKVWKVATPAERDELRPLLAQTLINADKPNGSFAHLTEDELVRLGNKLRAAAKDDPDLVDTIRKLE